MQLAEQYRPRSWSEVIGQDKIIGRLQSLAQTRGLAGRAYFIGGQSGTGKTTIARLIALEIADELFIEEIDATTLTVGKLAEIEKAYQCTSWGKGGRAFIVNEAHGLRKDVIRQLLVILERIPAHVAIVFTTTVEGQESLFEDYDDASPLLSRCLPLNLSRRDLAKPFAERCRQIAQTENLDGKPVEDYVKLMQRCKNNFRAALSAIESGEMVS